MHIGVDITALYVAQAGVFWQNLNLLRAMLEIDHDNTYTLVDYYPIHGGKTNQPVVEQLQVPHSTIVRVGGLRHYQLSRWQPLQRPVLRDVARYVDTVIERPLSIVTDAVMHSRLKKVLQDVDVFHASDVLFYAHPGALNVSTIHDLTTLLFPELHTAGNRALHLQKLRFVQEHADVVITVSECTKRDVVKHLGITPERVYVVYNGVNPDFHPIEDNAYITRVLARYGLSPKTYILHVGTLEPRKNLMHLVQAYRHLLDIIPTLALKLVLVGHAGWHFEQLFELVETLQLKDRVIFVGSVPAEVLPALYNGASLFVYPSLYEGFGLPPLEAMAVGVPVIASSASCLPEALGDAAYYINPYDLADMTKAFVDISSNKDLRLRLKSQGLKQVSLYSWDTTATLTWETYKEIL
ncbi:MAG: glycosyltransferase family 1 protein [Anaerolineales bacterium]|nr:MAG: glycosyltransferase family 1 protein [Anaerolineales bacterium]